ncbi:MAG: ATP-binding cassette domain-containing protein [Bacteroidetes bacterium]|nr:ATP-binding cassette domain-containing protein [Bacteroidota bacterium]
MIVAQNLVKTFEGITAVNNLSFNVKRGEIFGLLGPNGAGKSTTIRMLLSILLPDSGKITYDEISFNDAIRNKVGYLPEERGVYQKNNLIDVLNYFASLKGMNISESNKVALKLLGRFDLITYAKKQIRELSKGNQQKVQFIISILHNPDYIILDEPFSGLDPINQILLKEIINELKEQGKVIIFSTHQMEAAEKLCDSISIINNGKVVVQGELSKIKKDFGDKTIRLEFDGESSNLEKNENIIKLNLFENYLECELKNNISTKQFLNSIPDTISIKKFEFVEPSLEKIFMTSVAKSEVQANE